MVVSELDAIAAYEPDRYDDWSLDQIITAMRGSTLGLLKRGTMATLLARRELGGMLVAVSKLVRATLQQEKLFRRILDLDYSDARRYMQIWVYWDRIAKMLRDREESCDDRGIPFIVPGYRRCLELAGITKRDPPPYDTPPPLPEPEPLPDDVTALTKMVEELQQKNRMERAANTHLTVELDLAHDEIRDLSFNMQRESGEPSMFGAFTGWLRRKIAPPASDRVGAIDVRIGDCLTLIEETPNIYDAIVTDPPYAIGLHGYEWDNTDISFSPELWNRFMTVLKPGGYIAFFAAARLYHRAAQAAETAGFAVMPFLAWRFRDGLPKPINVSELFDRDNIDERQIVGERVGSGFTKANVVHGAQNRTHTSFIARARHVSTEAQDWRGYYYGKNALKPCIEPVLLVQKPIATERMIDNIRTWGTGALNIGAVQDRYGHWPSTLFTHRKASKDDHQSSHPSVKPTMLMEDICTLVCPGGGRILDPFAGTGSTGIAAQRRGFDCVLIEQDEMMRQVINDRLSRD